jgi:hypothetical protein
MTEQLTVYKPLGQSSTIYSDKRSILSLAVEVDGPGDVFLSRPGLPFNDDRHVYRGNNADMFENFLEFLACSRNKILLEIDWRDLCLLWDRCFFDQLQELFMYEGFGNIIVGPRFDESDGSIQIPYRQS